MLVQLLLQLRYLVGNPFLQGGVPLLEPGLHLLHLVELGSGRYGGGALDGDEVTAGSDPLDPADDLPVGTTDPGTTPPTDTSTGTGPGTGTDDTRVDAGEAAPDPRGCGCSTAPSPAALLGPLLGVVAAWRRRGRTRRPRSPGQGVDGAGPRETATSSRP